MMGGGVLLVVVGIVGWMFSGGVDETDDPLASETTKQETTTTASTTTTVPSTTTTRPTTTTTQPSTTTVPEPTTTALDTTAAIEQFVADFADAMTNQDVDFLLDRLHPIVLERFDSPSCRAFIEEEILLLQDYRLNGTIEGPTRQSMGTTVVNLYTVPVAFSFQGQEFASDAEFAFVGSEVRWFTQCGTP